MAAAICGRTPYMGLLVPENRRATHLVELEDLDVSGWTSAEFHCLGYCIGHRIPGFKPVAVNGLPPNLPFDLARALIISMPTSGAITLAHIVGTTPEAPTLEAALGGKKPEHVIRINKSLLKETWERLNVWENDVVDHVAFGCPHATIDEIGRVAAMLDGRTIKTTMLIGASAPVEALARRQGWAQVIEKAGAHFLPACPSITNPFVLRTVAGGPAGQKRGHPFGQKRPLPCLRGRCKGLFRNRNPMRERRHHGPLERRGTPMEIKAHKVSQGKARGEAVVYEGPFAFLGDLDPATGKICLPRHRLEGVRVAGKILVITTGKGSSGCDMAAWNAKQNNNAPAAIICRETEPVLSGAALVAGIPAVDRPEVDVFQHIQTGDNVEVDATEGVIRVISG